MIHFPSASPPDILRAVQKDEYTLKYLGKSLKEIAASFKGTRFVMEYEKILKWTSDSLYYGLTTACGKQTLGEEYADILMVSAANGSGITLAGYKRRILLVAFLVFSPFLVRRFLAFTKKMADATVSQRFSSLFSYLNSFLEGPLESLHLAYFYFGGAYYHISHMILRQSYILIRKGTAAPDEEGSPYEVLGFLILVKLLVNSLAGWRRKKTVHQDCKSDSNQDLDSDAISLTDNRNVKKCSMCLGPRRVATAAACGHVFCWICWCEWLNTKNECPFCRQEVFSRGLLPIVNF